MATSDIDESVSDEATLGVLGRRLASQRVQAQLTQAQLATAAGVSKRTVERIEAGLGCDLTMLARVLRVLKLSAGFNALIPALPPSPIQQLNLRGRQRQRVRAPRKQRTGTREPWRWEES